VGRIDGALRPETRSLETSSGMTAKILRDGIGEETEPVRSAPCVMRDDAPMLPKAYGSCRSIPAAARAQYAALRSVIVFEGEVGTANGSGQL
jgi:hypothetical protein